MFRTWIQAHHWLPSYTRIYEAKWLSLAWNGTPRRPSPLIHVWTLTSAILLQAYNDAEFGTEISLKEKCQEDHKEGEFCVAPRLAELTKNVKVLFFLWPRRSIAVCSTAWEWDIPLANTILSSMQNTEKALNNFLWCIFVISHYSSLDLVKALAS